MSKPTAVLFCPGRGSYGKPELGFLQRTLQQGPVSDALDASDAWRKEQGRPTIREIDFSRPTQSLRVISELVITTARNSPDSATRMMSVVRRVSGCSRSPVTAMSRPSTRTG